MRKNLDGTRARFTTTPGAVHATGPGEASGAKAPAVAGGPGAMRPKEAAKAVREGCAETPACARSPRGAGAG